jgi:hypothetical protein
MSIRAGDTSYTWWREANAMIDGHQIIICDKKRSSVPDGVICDFRWEKLLWFVEVM